MTPKCCKNCQHLNPTGFCNRYRYCAPWREWFSRQWSRIRKAAALAIESRERRNDKLQELREEYKEEQK